MPMQDLPRKTIVVTGATGWLGNYVCSHLQRSGATVVAISRKKTVGPWDIFVEHNIRDAFPEKTLDFHAKHKPHAVVHCAAHVHSRRPPESERSLYQTTNAVGTRNVLSFAERAGVKRFIHISTMAVYDWGKSNGPADEDSPVTRADPYASSKLDAEAAVMSSSINYCIVRLATLFGAGDNNNFLRLAKALRERRFLVPGNGDAYKSFIAVDAAADCIAQLAQNEALDNDLLNLASPERMCLRDICNVFSETCNLPRARSVPIPLLKLAALVGDIAAKGGVKLPLDTATLHKLLTSTPLGTARAVRTFPLLKNHSFTNHLRQAQPWYSRPRRHMQRGAHAL